MKLKLKNKKVILLDVDGVLSPFFSVKEESVIVNTDWSTAVVPTRIAYFIREISNQIKIVWLTSWNKCSLEISEQLKFNITDYIEINNDFDELWQKKNEIKSFCKLNKKYDILLIDDEANLDYFKDNKNLTIIVPDSTIGLSESNISEISNWLQK